MDPVWTLYFDGSSFGKGRRGGPGPSAGAAVIISEQGEVLQSTVYLLRADSDTAEYRGLICGLEKAQNTGARKIHIRGDSRNVIDQLSGRKILKKDELLMLARRSAQLLAGFESWSLEWIPRRKNETADRLARACVANAASLDGDIQP